MRLPPLPACSTRWQLGTRAPECRRAARASASGNYASLAAAAERCDPPSERCLPPMRQSRHSTVAMFCNGRLYPIETQGASWEERQRGGRAALPIIAGLHRHRSHQQVARAVPHQLLHFPRWPNAASTTAGWLRSLGPSHAAVDAAPFALCAAQYAVPCALRAAPDAAPYELCAAPDAVACRSGEWLSCWSAELARLSCWAGPQHLIPLTPWATPSSSTRPFPKKWKRLLGARSFPFHFFQSRPTSLFDC
jgi:hypothetical protein